ncbi:MAG: uridine diphosphate-N-acetylglucosamine-binding protein YvcK [Candidatus Paceibacterota bacterium]|jgi:uncharacterized cofD-like protein
MKKVVVIGGGTGVFTVLSGLKEYLYHLSAIVTIADDGGSSGILREEFGILPPGDIRRALVALSSSSPFLAKLFQYRFKNGEGLKGHSFGNLFLTALKGLTGNFNQAIKEAGNILGIKGEVIPVSLNNTRLFARLENDFLVIGESNIDVPKHDGNLLIKEVFLNPQVKANEEALKAIKDADLIIFGPGDLYSSIIPNFLVKGIKEAIKKSKAKKVYISNIMTKFGETNHFTAEQFLTVIEKYLGKGIIDYFLVNIEKPKKSYLEKYKREKAELVKYNKQYLSALKKPKVIFAKLVRSSHLLRHDSKKIAKVIEKIIHYDRRRIY